MQALTQDFRCGAAGFAGKDAGTDTAETVEPDEGSDEQRQTRTIGDSRNYREKNAAA